MENKEIDNLKIKTPMNFLGMKTIISDIKELPKKFKIILLIVGIVSLILSFIDFNHFISIEGNESIFTIVNTLNAPKSFLGNMPKWLDATFVSLSGFAAFTTILNVFLISFGKFSNYFWGVINAIVFGLFSFDYGYTGDAQINFLFYLPMQFVGWFMWQRSQNIQMNGNDKELEFRKSKWWVWTPIALIALVPLTFIFFYEIPWFHNVLTQADYSYALKAQIIPHICDSITNSTAIVAFILMIFRFKENWLIWLFQNLVSLIMFAGVNNIGSETPGFQMNINTLIQLIILTINSIIGFLSWGGYLDKKDNSK